MAPSLVGTPDIQYQDAINTTSLVSAALTVQVGDILVIKTVTADSSQYVSACTVDTVAATKRGEVTQGSYCHVGVYTFIATATSHTVTTAITGAPGSWHSMVTEVWRGAQLAGTPAVNTTKYWSTSSTGFSASVTTVANDSIVTWVAGDWTAAAFGTIGYRSSATTDGATSNRGGNANDYSTYFAYQTAASAGAQTFGTTSPSVTSKFSAIGIEVQDSGGVAAPPFWALMPPMNRH